MRKVCLGLSLATGVVSAPALAEYPERPILFINPNSAGGGTDIGVRTWAPYVEKCLGVASLVVAARPGATGAIGISETARATNDGYTIGSLNIMDAEQTEAFVRQQDELLRDLWQASPWVTQ